MTLALLIIVTLVVAFLAIVEEEERAFYKPYVYWSVAIVLILCATIRDPGFDRDSLNYEYRFLHPYDDRAMVKEPTFVGIVEFIRLFSDDVHVLFFCYALLGVSLKFLAFRKLTPLYFLPLAIYMGNYYVLHELTQIRAGVASAFFLLAIPPLAQGKRWVAFFLMAAAAMFHFSALAYLPVLVLNDKPLSKWWRIAMATIVPIGYAFYLLGIDTDIIALINIPGLTHKVEIYQGLRDKGVLGYQINVFNAVFLVKLLIYFYLLYFYDTLVHFGRYISLMLKVMALSIAVFLFFAGLPVVAFRVSEMLSVVDIILYSYIFFTLRPVWFGRTIVVVISLALFAINIFYTRILESV